MGKAHTHAPAADTLALITIPAITDGNVEIEQLAWSFDAAPAAAKLLSIESPSGTILYQFEITAAGPGFIPFSGSCIRGAKSQAMLVRLAADTGGAKGKVSCIQRT